MTRLPRTSPESVGLDPEALETLVAALEGIRDLHSVMVLRHGAVVAEAWWRPYTAETPHLLFSVSKSVTATAVGLAIEEGLLGLDDRVIDLLPEDAPADPGPNLAAMRVRHLLTMTSGHAEDTIGLVDPELDGHGVGESWARTILAAPVAHEPGTRFVYDTGATYLLSAILQRLTGERLTDYLEPRLFAPLGIARPTWEQDPQGIDAGGYGLSLRTEELAAIGQLYLQRGLWEGRQILPESWVDAATSAQVASEMGTGPDWMQGYGFQFWRGRHGSYRGDGAFGQFLLVWPEHDIVIAMTSGVADMQEVLDTVWDTLLPVPPAPAGELVPDSGALAFGALELPLPAGAEHSPDAGALLGRFDLRGRYRIASLRIEPDEAGLALTFDRAGTEHRVIAGHGRWVEGRSALDSAEEAPVAAAYAFSEDATLAVRILFPATPFAWLLTLRVEDDAVELTLDRNVSFGPGRLVELRVAR